MESQDNQFNIPQCPHLRPSNSSQDFDDITLQDNFSLSEIETQTPGAENFHQDFIIEDDEPISKGKRSFNQVCTTNKPSFQYYIQRPQKRPHKKIHR